MPTETEPDRRLQGIISALSRNRGEIDHTTLERLLRLVARGAPKSAAS